MGYAEASQSLLNVFTFPPAGRMLIAQGAVDACKIGVTIAVRYAAQRPQFGGKIILEYLTHQRRLFPALATTYAMHIALTRLKVCLLLLHVYSAN